MSKHTKGPWIALPEECDKPYIRIRVTTPGGRYKVANVLTPVYDGIHQREAEETRANARLIAAAPELLAALEEIIGAGSWYISALEIDVFRGPEPAKDGEELYRMARAAIAKARGGA